jgi:hypothetical protein
MVFKFEAPVAAVRIGKMREFNLRHSKVPLFENG